MTPQPPHVQTAMARAELKALQSHQSTAEYGVEILSNAAIDLQSAEDGTITREKAILSAVMALCALRLSELQTAHTANAERIAQLEGFLAKADSRIAIPNLQV